MHSLPLHICKDLVLVCYRYYRYPGCTTRTSVPSQPTALQKPSYKKEPYLQNKNTTTTTTTQPNQPPTPTPTTANLFANGGRLAKLLDPARAILVMTHGDIHPHDHDHHLHMQQVDDHQD